MKPILEVKGVSKQYRIGEKVRYLSLRESISDPFKNVAGFFKGKDKVTDNSFWALQDISFDVFGGESIGIIGRNGAGKSTLLKILSRITPPTQGVITCRGRVASLLEVGTGFHSELSGRENVFMNGSILGMRKSEIRKHFDAIVEFSGVGRFLDTPLKKYSSGMQLRLAFAVAAHLEPEILIIDEVLAVGDAEFQKRCLGKMKEVSESGRTVLFVSHDLTAVRALTQKCILLKDGKKIDYDSTEKIISLYINEQIDSKSELNIVGKSCKLFSASIVDESGNSVSVHDPNADVTIDFTFYKGDNTSLSFDFFLKDGLHNKLAMASLSHFENQTLPAEKGVYSCRVTLDKMYLASGRYFIDIAISQPKIGWDLYADSAISFDVLMCNPRRFSWDLKQEYKYGNLAWLLTKDPKYTLNGEADFDV